MAMRTKCVDIDPEMQPQMPHAGRLLPNDVRSLRILW